MGCDQKRGGGDIVDGNLGGGVWGGEAGEEDCQ